MYEMYEVGGKDACTLRCQLNGSVQTFILFFFLKSWSLSLFSLCNPMVISYNRMVISYNPMVIS